MFGRANFAWAQRREHHDDLHSRVKSRRKGRLQARRPAAIRLELDDAVGLLRFGERRCPILRAGIWIYHPTGSVSRKKRLTKRASLEDIAADLALLTLQYS